MTRCRIKDLPGLLLGLMLAAAPARFARAAGPGAPSDPKRLEAGAALYRQSRYQEAMGRFLLILEKNPSDIEAREFEQRSLDAMVHERIMAARLTAGQMLLQALSRREKLSVAALLTLQAAERMSQEDPIGAQDLLLKVLDLEPGFPDAEVGLKHNQMLLRRMLTVRRMSGAPSQHYSRHFVLQALVLFNDRDLKGALPLLQQALFLVSPSADEFSVVRSFLMRVQSAGLSPVPVRSVAAPSPPPSPVRAGPPTPAVLPRYAKASLEVEILDPAPRPHRRRNRRAQAAAVAVPEAKTTGVQSPVVPIIPPPSGPADPAKSDDIYLKGVTAYFAGQVKEARRDLLDALAADPDNQRAKKLLDRIDRESRTGP